MEDKSCNSCGICTARNLLTGKVVAVLIESGVTSTFESRDKAEDALIKARITNPEAFLIRGYIPEELKSYNLVDGDDIPI